MNRTKHQKVAIQYGIGAGRQTAKRLKRCLRQAGYQIVEDSHQADIIIAHSAGCFQLPTAPTNQKLLLVDPPYWPGRTAWQRGRLRMQSNFRFRQYGYSLPYWLTRNAWGWFYFIRDFKRTRWIFQYVKQYDLSTASGGHRAIIVRNNDDDWLTPDVGHLKALTTANPNLIIRHLPGDHNDILHNPAPYVALLDEL